MVSHSVGNWCGGAAQVYEDASGGGRCLLESLRVGSLLSVQVTKVIRMKRRETEREAGRQTEVENIAIR